MRQENLDSNFDRSSGVIGGVPTSGIGWAEEPSTGILNVLSGQMGLTLLVKQCFALSMGGSRLPLENAVIVGRFGVNRGNQIKPMRGTFLMGWQPVVSWSLSTI